MIKALVIGALLLSMSGCVITLVYDITVRVTNNSDEWVDVYYRESGTSDWSSPITVFDYDSKTFDLPSPGDYDFLVVDNLTQGFGNVNKSFYNEDCTLDWGSIDYEITIFSDYDVTFNYY